MTFNLCEHPSIAYEVSHRTARPFRWIIHSLRCTTCGAKAIVIDRKKANA